MALQNQIITALAGAGGTPPYTFTLISDGQTTIPATLSGATLTVDATTKEPGSYSVHIQVTDAAGNGTSQVVPITVVDASIFTILATDLAYPPAPLPYSVSTILQSIGGKGAIAWSIIPSITSLPGVQLTGGGNLTFTLTQYGAWTVGVRATDAVGNTTSLVVEVSMAAATAYSLVDGQVEVNLSVSNSNVGTHNFTLTVMDKLANTAHQSFTYTAGSQVSAIDPIEAAVEHYWGPGDTTTVVYPIAGNLAGFTLGPLSPLVASNGLTAQVDPLNKVIEISGPPTSFGNAELDIPITLYRGSQKVAVVTRTYTLLSHGSNTDLAGFTCRTKPYIVGESLGLNPKKPFFNSPEVFSSVGYTARVQLGSQLPLGLSLDANTGLIYGTVLANDVSSSTVEYVDASGVVHGTGAILWDIQASAFPLVDGLTTGLIQSPYSGLITGPSTAAIINVSVYRGRLPNGVIASVDSTGHNILISGTPTEAGYFDIWFRAINAAGQVALVYKRFAVAYIAPLVVLTDAIAPFSTNQSYAQLLTAFGGVQPYTWSLASGTLPSGLTLTAASGEVSGTSAVSSYASQSLTFTVTDARGATASASLQLALVTQLAISTTILPSPISGQPYTYQMQAIGGTPAYTWALSSTSPTLPSGITLSSSGILSGITTQSGFNQSVAIQVVDAASGSATRTFTLRVATSSSLAINTSGIGPIIKGGPYQGGVAVSGTGAGPYRWSIAPDTPSPLPAGLVFTADQSTYGATATLAGTTTSVLTNYSVKIQVVDANGNSATGFILLNSISSLAITTSSPLPQAVVGTPYQQQLAVTGYNPAFSWSQTLGSPALPSGMTLSTSGLLSGTPTTVYSAGLGVQVADSLGDVVTTTLQLAAHASTLLLVTSALAAATAGLVYTQTLGASGGTQPYTWSISPNTVGQLPSGLSLNASSGLISGTTLQAGSSPSITFRVTDAAGSYVERALTLTVNSGLQIFTGIDYNLHLSTGLLGYCSGGDVTSINPRPAGSFLVIATGVISTSTSTFSASLPNSFSVQSYTFSGGTCVMVLAGPFGSGSVGNNSLSVTVVDSGVTVTQVFTWVVNPYQALTLAPTHGSIPLRTIS